MRFVTSLLLLIFSASCSEKKSVPDSEIFSPGRRLGELRDERLEEASGLAASAANHGLLWTLNDSGNPAVIYLIDEDLNIKLSCELKGVRNRDWEDIAVGPGPEENKHYLYVGDIGDNNGNHNVKYIYRFEEPVLNAQQTEITITSFDTLVFRLSDEKKDTEAMIVHPETKDIYLVSKREKPVHLYELKYPQTEGDTLTAEKLMPISLTQIVAAAISPDGEEILMKNYDNVYYWDVEGRSIPDVLKGKPQILNYTEEPQGEAITFNRDASGFYTLSEKIKGEKSYLYYYERNKP